MIAQYTVPYETLDVNIFAFDVFAGIIVMDFLNISWTLRTNFEGVSNKLAVGYIHRF